MSDSTAFKRKRGRPVGTGTGLAPKKNVTIDPDALVLLQTVQEMMEQELGFRPSLAQTVKRLAAIYAANRTLVPVGGVS